MNDDVTTDHDRRDDDKRNVTLDDDFVTSATVKEGSAEEGAAPAPKRVWPRNTALAVAAAAQAPPPEAAPPALGLHRRAPDSTSRSSGAAATAPRALGSDRQ
ncbi:hypothetical protein ACIHCX_00110 [Streptomyces sp. NPDC052043]|uniref:hypothetical protein n=1 Tax=Streptomyces sp. NPDC052043 TaxID=3365684 RepID=UPI0037CCE181